MSDDIFADPQPDGFNTESPTRAFTNWREGERYAIGKGFRPSVHHLVAYLDALDRKEGWELVQILYADHSHGERRTMVFRRKPLLANGVDIETITGMFPSDIESEEIGFADLGKRHTVPAETIDRPNDTEKRGYAAAMSGAMDRGKGLEPWRSRPPTKSPSRC